MGRILKAILLMFLVFLAILLFSLLAAWSKGRVILQAVIWVAGMSFAVFAKLKWSEYKGLSTVLAWVAFGLLLYTIVWLAPVGAIKDDLYVLLVFVTLGLVLWDRYRLPR